MKNRVASFACILAPLAFVVVVFLVPMSKVLTASVDNSILHDSFSRTTKVLSTGQLVSDAGAVALALDLREADKRQIAVAARLLNQTKSGYRGLLIDTKAALRDRKVDTLEDLVALDARWAEPVYWSILRHNSQRWTSRYYQAVFGGQTDEDGQQRMALGEAVYLDAIYRTLAISLQVALLAVVIGYPIAYAIANGSPMVRAALLSAVLLSFWISILVRTTAWVVVLQREGIVNDLLTALHIIDSPIQLIFNRIGMVIAMIHIMLPFAVLPLVNNMRNIPLQQRQASRIMGAGPVETFFRVYLPQTTHGMFVGGGIVFVLSLGFYVTPALVGGSGDQMLSYYVAQFMLKELNWGLASALSVVLLGSVALVLMLGWMMRRALGLLKAA